KRVFPDAVWPADIPGTSPLSIHAISRAYYKPDSGVKTYFEFPHELEVLFGGTMGETFSMFGEVELEIEDNEVVTVFPFFLQYDYRPWLHARVGTVNPDFTGDKRQLTREHNNVVSLRGRNGWRLRDEQSGVEVWGARNGAGGRGGLTYGVGLVNGQDIIDANSEKDLYVRAAYKFKGLGNWAALRGRRVRSRHSTWTIRPRSAGLPIWGPPRKRAREMRTSGPWASPLTCGTGGPISPGR
ncbi:MAG: hypothetical protein HW414_1869, partial [Dehalococcoidia bacterium]|nr:hypothetical protein [Dehalococcoidia bacterium]